MAIGAKGTTLLPVSQRLYSAVSVASISRPKAASIFCVNSSSPLRQLCAAPDGAEPWRSQIACDPPLPPSLAASMRSACLPNRQRKRSEFSETTGGSPDVQSPLTKLIPCLWFARAFIIILRSWLSHRAARHLLVVVTFRPQALANIGDAHAKLGKLEGALQCPFWFDP